MGAIRWQCVHLGLSQDYQRVITGLFGQRSYTWAVRTPNHDFKREFKLTMLFRAPLAGWNQERERDRHIHTERDRHRHIYIYIERERERERVAPGRVELYQPDAVSSEPPVPQVFSELRDQGMVLV